MTEKDPWSYEGMEYEGGELDDKDIEAVEDAISYLEDKIADIPGGVVIHKEVSFDLSKVHPDLYGTADLVLYTEDRKYLGVFDYKHGSGVPVNAVRNIQLLYYTLGAINWLAGDMINVMGWGSAFETVEMGIIQPRAYHVDGPFRTISVLPQTIEWFAEELKTKAKETTKKDATLNSGSWCRWCPAKPLCPKLYEKTMEVTQRDFKALDTLDMPTVAQLTPGEIGKVLEFEDIISGWLKEVKALALRQLEHGEKVPGYKLVKKKAKRVWRDEKGVVNKLTSLGWEHTEIYELKIKSPAKIEKLNHKKEPIDEFIEKPDTGNTIAPEHDRRKEVPPAVEIEFEDLTKGK